MFVDFAWFHPNGWLKSLISKYYLIGIEEYDGFRVCDPQGLKPSGSTKGNTCILLHLPGEAE